MGIIGDVVMDSVLEEVVHDYLREDSDCMEGYTWDAEFSGDVGGPPEGDVGDDGVWTMIG